MATVADLEKTVTDLQQEVSKLREELDMTKTSLAELESAWDDEVGTGTTRGGVIDQDDYEKERDAKGNVTSIKHDGAFALYADANGDVIRDPNRA